MKLPIVFLLLFVLTQQVLGQQVKFEVSKPYKVIDGVKMYLSQENNNKVLALKINRSGFYLQSFDTESMKELKRTKYKDFPKGYQIESLQWFGGRIFLFYSLYDKKTQIRDLYARQVDFEKAEFVGTDRNVMSIEGKNVYLSIARSFDRSKFLVHYKRYPEHRRNVINHDVYGNFIFDADFNRISGGDVRMPYTEAQVNLVSYELDSDGNTYFLTEVKKEDAPKGKDRKVESSYNIELFKIPMGTKELRPTTRIQKDEFFNAMELFEGKKNQMVLAGFYSKQNTGNTDGLFMYKIDSEGNLTDKQLYEIPVELLKEYTNERGKKRKEKEEAKDKAEFERLVMRDVKIQDDGSILMIGEQYFTVTRTYTSSNGSISSRTTFHYYDILVTKIDADGDLAWMKKLPKRQVGSAGRGGLGFRYLEINGEHYFIYLDNVKNLDLPKDELPAAHVDGRGGFLTAYKLQDDSGTMQKISIFDVTDVNRYKLYQFSTGRVLDLGNGRFAIEFYKKNKEDVMVVFDAN